MAVKPASQLVKGDVFSFPNDRAVSVVVVPPHEYAAGWVWFTTHDAETDRPEGKTVVPATMNVTIVDDDEDNMDAGTGHGAYEYR